MKENSKENLKKNLLKENYKTHFISYIIITLYSFIMFFVGTFINSLGDIIVILTKLYNMESSQVSLSSGILSISFGVSVLPFLYFSKRYGIRKSILWGIFLFILGTSWRLLINYSIFLFYLGYIFLGLGSPLILNSHLKIVSIWVHPDYRNLINALIAIIGPIGAGISQMIPLIFIDKSELNLKVLEKQLMGFFIFYILCMIILLVINFFLLKEYPPKGFGNLDSKREKDITINLKDFIDLIRNKHFIFPSLIYGISLTTISVLGNSIYPILYPFDCNKTLGIILSIIVVLGGLIGSIIFSIFIQKRIKNKSGIQILFINAMLGIIICPFGIIWKKYVFFTYLGCTLMGIGILSHCSIIFEYLSIHFKKYNFFTINTILIISQQIIQGISLSLFGYIWSYQLKFFSLLTILIIQIFYFICLIFSLFLK